MRIGFRKKGRVKQIRHGYKHLTKKCYTGTSVRCRGSSHTSKQEARRLHNSTNDLPVVRHGCLVDGITHSVTDFVSTPAVVSTLATFATLASFAALAAETTTDPFTDFVAVLLRVATIVVVTILGRITLGGLVGRHRIVLVVVLGGLVGRHRIVLVIVVTPTGVITTTTATSANVSSRVPRVLVPTVPEGILFIV